MAVIRTVGRECPYQAASPDRDISKKRLAYRNAPAAARGTSVTASRREFGVRVSCLGLIGNVHDTLLHEETGVYTGWVNFRGKTDAFWIFDYDADIVDFLEPRYMVLNSRLGQPLLRNSVATFRLPFFSIGWVHDPFFV